MNFQLSRWMRPGLVLAMLVPCLAVLTSRPAHSQLLKGPSVRSARNEAVQAIPFAAITPAMQQQIRRVVTKPTVYRRLPHETITCDPNLYLFLLRHPEVVVGIWDLMGATQIELQRTGPYTFRAADSAGTTSDIQLVYGTRDIHIFYAEGTYEGSLLSHSVEGRCVLVVQTAYQQQPDGTPRVTTMLDMFLQIDAPGIDVLVKTFQPFLGKYADYNFVETARFLQRLSQTAESNAAGMQRLAQRLEHVDGETRQQFAVLSAQVAQQAAARAEAAEAAAAGTEHVAPVHVPQQGLLREATYHQPQTHSVPPAHRRASHAPEILSRYPVDYPTIR